MAGVRSTRRVSLYDGRRGTLVRTRGDVADVRWDDKPHKIRSAYLHDLRRAA